MLAHDYTSELKLIDIMDLPRRGKLINGAFRVKKACFVNRAGQGPVRFGSASERCTNFLPCPYVMHENDQFGR